MVTRAYLDATTARWTSYTTLATLSLLPRFSLKPVQAIDAVSALLTRWTRCSLHRLDVVNVICELLVFLEYIRFHVTDVIEDGLLKFLHVCIERLLLLCRSAIHT